MKRMTGYLAALLACSMLVGCATAGVDIDAVQQAEQTTQQMSERLLAPKDGGSSSTSSSAAKTKRTGESSGSSTSGSLSAKDTEMEQNVKLTEPEIFFSSKSAAVGDMLTITVVAVKNKVTANSNMQGLAPKFFEKSKGVQVALVPVSYKLTPGTYTLNITADGKTQQFKITAGEKQFNVQNLWVDESTTQATIASDKANQEWNEKIEPLKPISDAKQYWDGAFLQPVQGRITTPYATKRYTNGGSTPSFHGGVDIAAATGTPVLATGAGRVQFAEFIQLTGNTVVIEHGYGLKSFYYHMNSLDVKTGDMVERGQQIGKVGSTGFSTGPHLHFAMAVNNVFTNPWQLIEEAPLS